MSLILIQIQTITANRFMFDYSGFDHLIGTRYATLAALTEAVRADFTTQTDVVATYGLLGRTYSVRISAQHPSSGPCHVNE